MTASRSELVERVAAQIVSGSWNMEKHDWEKGCAINGLLATDQQVEEARRLVDRSVETQTSDGQLSYGSLGSTPYGWEADWATGEYKSYADPVVPGHGVLEFYDRTGESFLLEAARKQYEQLRRIETTEDGGIPISRGTTDLLLDSLYHFCPFMARYGLLADDPDAIDEAVKQIEVHADHLYDSYTGLYRQGWTESPKDSFKQDTFWSRGVGWLTTAIVDTYQYLPEDHAGREPLAEMLRDLSETLLDYQDASGFWHNTLDDDESPLETSGTLMFAYSFRRGLDLGILSDERFEASAQRAMDVCDGTVNRDGEVRRVSVVPGGPNSPLGVALHGQGWYLLAASCFAD
jgi:unsaturated rhamnogalacturonyl hydrolase